MASAWISLRLVDISSWMTAHQLKLNPSKTELLVIPATACNLGVIVDNQLSFSSHVTNVTRSCRFLLYNIRRIRPFLSTQATQVLVQSLVISRLDYCNSLLAGLPLNAIRPLQMIQNAAARLVFNLPKFSHTTPLLRSLHWLPVAARIRFKTLMLAYKAKNGPAPSYLKALVTPHTAPRSLRSTSTARLVPPSLREKGRHTSRLFSVLALRRWNELPLGIRTAESLTIFKRQVKTYLFLKQSVSMSDEPGPSKQTHSQSQTQSQPSSSSSSGPASSSQSSSSGSGTLSSVDTVPITELSSIPEEPEEPEPKYWGRIVPLIRGFTVLNCVENQYYFGRDSRNDYCFNDPIVLKSPHYRTYSKRHFKIFRDESVVYLEDLSVNGTWVDDTEVGKGKRCPLSNNSVVSLADPKHKVFMFVDMTEDDQPNFPKEFREKYHVTRRIGSGVCGEVKLAIERETCKKVALKTINKNDFPSVGTATRNAEREIEILKKIDHPCLIRTEDFYQTQDSYYIVLEYISMRMASFTVTLNQKMCFWLLTMMSVSLSVGSAALNTPVLRKQNPAGAGPSLDATGADTISVYNCD
ncbi:hypothetical protein QTP70_012098 [Hemibagrus guttatus]|uniref:Serine/threonine-protein kinase Chk2 n=1 Tax=Hemibagrus guttatus TaxID=175788 RepID=A0AAE0UPU4_9TELE|nr:hypothetical protein QTP70_012098 [Hemibagrus guttatus]